MDEGGCRLAVGPDLAKFRRLGAILKGFGNIFDGLFSAWKNFGTFWQILYAIGQRFIILNWQI